MANVLAVVAHPDDESLLMGGTLAWHAKEGDAVRVVALSDGVGSRYPLKTAAYADSVERRRLAFVAALSILGAEGGIHFAFEDQQSDAVPQWQINLVVGCLVRQHQPDSVYTHYPHDLNLDHRRVAEAVLVETRGKCSVFCAEPEYSSRALVPFTGKHMFGIDIEKKLAACACYPDELREYPHPRSLRAIKERAYHHDENFLGYPREAFVVYA